MLVVLSLNHLEGSGLRCSRVISSSAINGANRTQFFKLSMSLQVEVFTPVVSLVQSQGPRQAETKACRKLAQSLCELKKLDGGRAILRMDMVFWMVIFLSPVKSLLRIHVLRVYKETMDTSSLVRACGP